MATAALFRRLQSRLASILTARRSVQEASDRVDDLRRLLEAAERDLAGAQASLLGAEMEWDQALDEVVAEDPGLEGRLPPRSDDPSFRPDRVELRVA